MPIEECPLDAIEYFSEILDRYPRHIKAGFGLRIDDLPEHYSMRDEVRTVERYNWERPLAPRLYDAFIDTTFALYRGPEAFDQVPAVRTGYPYLARHTTWYLDEGNLPEEERFYRDRSTLTPWWSRDAVPAKLDRLVGAMRDRAAPGVAADMTWGEEPEPRDETEFTPWAEQGWRSWNERAPEAGFCELAANLVETLRPRVVLETGTGEGFMTRRLAGALGAAQTLVSFEADEEVRGALASLPFFAERCAPSLPRADAECGRTRPRRSDHPRLRLRAAAGRGRALVAQRGGRVGAARPRHRERPPGRLTAGSARRADPSARRSPACSCATRAAGSWASSRAGVAPRRRVKHRSATDPAKFGDLRPNVGRETPKFVPRFGPGSFNAGFLFAYSVPRQVSQANRPWTGSRAHSSAGGNFGNFSGRSAMWMFAGIDRDQRGEQPPARAAARAAGQDREAAGQLGDAGGNVHLLFHWSSGGGTIAL